MTETNLNVGAVVTPVIANGLVIGPTDVIIVMDIRSSRVNPGALGQIVVITNTEALGLIVLEFVSLEFHVFGAQRTGSTDRNGHTS